MSESYLLSGSDVHAIQQAISGISRLETGLNLLNQGSHRPPISSYCWIGVIQSTGPSSQPQPTTGGLYWCAKADVSVNSSTNVWTVTAKSSSDPSYLNVLCANLKEIVSQTENLQSGDIVAVLELPSSAGATNPTPNYLILASNSPSLFPVNLTQSGGANGTSTTAATYTYILKSLSGTTLGTTGTTPVSPQWGRTYGEVNTATHGTAYYDASSGNVVLYQADETPMTGTC